MSADAASILAVVAQILLGDVAMAADGTVFGVMILEATVRDAVSAIQVPGTELGYGGNVQNSPQVLLAQALRLYIRRVGRTWKVCLDGRNARIYRGPAIPAQSALFVLRGVG